ncbi:hypothetical protein GJAV_G00126390 [Gymnothorax javanicus]|nr:hypothetical protein GJAV_G00126390 [Gymnothorax javanicus]
MASGVGKHKLLSLGPTEPWSVREKLCLASSVMKSGDQNWVSVSRAIKPFAEPGRPPDWFSQKHCASQYSELLETTETPKRKRGERGEVVETVEDVIVRKLTAERIEELKRLIKETQEKHRKLKKEAELIQAGHLDSKLEDLWGEILQKKKTDEEDAEQKRKATNAAYQARQAVKNTPKRVSSVTVRSPPEAGSPSLEFPLVDTPQPLPDDPGAMPSAPGTSVFMPLSEMAAGPVAAETGLGALLDDSPQKKLLGQKATPPPSPLLSELLKKGNLLSSSQQRLVGEGDISVGHVTGVLGPDLQLVASAMAVSQASGAPTLSRLLEAGPAQFPSPLSSLAAADLPSAPPTATAAPKQESPASLNAGADARIAAVGTASAGVGKAAELGEEDLVTVSYMGDELDLETVGDIIAIIEEKVDDNAEVLDAAAVEAALSLCEEAADSHTLPGPWEPGPFKPPESSPAALPGPSPVNCSLEPMEEKGIARGSASLISGPAHQEGMSLQPNSGPSSTFGLDQVLTPGARLEQTLQDGSNRGEGQREGHISIKCETEEWTGGDALFVDSISEDGLGPVKHSKEVKEEDMGSDGEDGGSMSETKDCGEAEECGVGDGEGAEPCYLSEAELEPPASESEDGYSLRTASSSLQLHNAADSTPSSPASSQFSISSEDQEAIQAQKIWKKAIMLVWRAAANHRYANVFLQPVTDDIAPGYHSIVHRPMDLSTIKKNIETGLIRSTAEFQRDIMLMFQNAVMYNSSDHDVFHMALEMQRDVLEHIQQFLATQLIMQTSESGISCKSLRGRESSRKQDPNDKDSVPMASPAFLLSLFDGGSRGRRCAIEADLKMKK